MKRFAIFALLALCLSVRADILPPRPATQSEVNAGIDGIHPVTPKTMGGFPFVATNLPLATLTNTINNQVSSGKQPFAYVINVKASPFNATGDGVADDWLPIQSALTAASLTNVGPIAVYIPEGTYRLTNTLALTTQTNAVTLGTTANPAIAQLFGDGGRRSILQFTVTNANGLEFRVVTNDPRHLSNFDVHDLAIMGPAVSGSTNVTGSGYFVGYSPDLPYAGDTVGFHDSIYNCWVGGWRQGLCITNTVFFTARNCNFQSNILHSVLLTHADTTRLENNNLGFPVVPNGDDSAIAVWGDKSGVAGVGVFSVGGESGNSACYASVRGGNFHQIAGNFERNTSMLIATNFCDTSFEGCRIANSPATNFTFNFYNGGASGFWAANCSIDTTNVFNQVPGSDITGEIPIHHALGQGNLFNGVFNGAPRNYPPVFFQTPRWTHSYQLAECVLLNCTALSPLSTSPSPFFSSDGVSINNTTGQLWLALPSGLGNNYSAGGLEQVRFTVIIQGGAGATNAQLTLTAQANRNNAVTGFAIDQGPAFTISGITNGMAKAFTWTNSWNATSDSNQRYSRLQFATTNLIYLVGLNAETIDY